MPRNRALRFNARALGTGDELGYTGETLATLATSNQNVEIPLAPVQNDQTFPIPRMFRISYPAEIFAGQEEQVTFTIQGNAGIPIHVRITAVGSPGTPAAAFSPATGTVTLTNTVANFMAVYTAPEVTEDTQLEYLVTISAANSATSVAVSTNFQTTVKRRPPGGVVTGTRPSVRFNPMVLSLTANGSATPGTVELIAAVSDDGAPAQLSYLWSYQPGAGTPSATFANAQSNPAAFLGYTLAHQGTIALAVTDGDGGTTTLRYQLVPDQFADAIDHGPVNGLRRVVAGRAHTCVLTGARKVRCWGDNEFGQLGYGNTTDVGDAPSRLPYTAGDVPLGPEPVVQLVAGADHTCALGESGLITCWGRNHHGQLGYNRTDNLADGEAVTSFGYVAVGDVATRIAAGGDHTCAVLVGGAVRCWGENNYGQLGHGNTADVGDNEPVYTVGNVDLGAVTVKDLALGAYHTCALLTTGAVRCWGYGAYGQLGYGNSTTLGDDEPINTLANVSLTGPVRKLVAGQYHTCALTDVGTLRCWGYNAWGTIGISRFFGSWGDNAGELPSTLPSDLATGSLVTDVSAGGFHTCALSNGGGIRCWGEGFSGQLGDGAFSYADAPPSADIDLDGVSAHQLTGGGNHTCALRVNGTARCWGAGDGGQLGLGSVNNLGTPSGAPDIQIFAP